MFAETFFVLSLIPEASCTVSDCGLSWASFSCLLVRSFVYKVVVPASVVATASTVIVVATVAAAGVDILGLKTFNNISSKSCIWNGGIRINAPAHEIMVLITQATSEGSGEPAHPHSLTRTFAFAHIKYRRRRTLRPNIRHLTPLDGCACAFEE